MTRTERVRQLLASARSLAQSGRPTEAEAAAKQILSLDSEQPDALHLLGILWYQTGNRAEGIGLLHRAVLGVGGNNPTYVANFARIIANAVPREEAEPWLARATALNPEAADLAHIHGEVLRGLNRLVEAEAAYRRALDLQPRYASALNGLGNVLHSRGDIGGAFECFRQVTEWEPEIPAAWFNRGDALRESQKFEDAITAYDRALALQPDFPQAHVHRAMSLLGLERWEEGWAEYEWRWRVPNFPTPKRPFPQPEWDGSSLSGTLFIHAEQGFGDTLQFSRYVTEAAERAHRVVFECPEPLKRLMRRLTGVADVIARGDPIPPFVAHAALLSLPRILEFASPPTPERYLFPDTDRVDAWSSRLKRDSRLDIALTWRSGRLHETSTYKSCPLTALAPLFAFGDAVQFHAVQKDHDPQEELHPRISDLGDALQDFDDTAAVLECMDLVICVDTATAHLAGAMGKPCWIMLSTAADWRWAGNGIGCRWYPSARLFRQSTQGDWRSVVQDIAEALGRQIASP